MKRLYIIQTLITFGAAGLNAVFCDTMKGMASFGIGIATGIALMLNQICIQDKVRGK